MKLTPRHFSRLTCSTTCTSSVSTPGNVPESVLINTIAAIGDRIPMSAWDMILDDLLEVVVETLRPQDVASMRSVCSTWREKLDCLLSTLQLRQPLYIPDMAARFQACPYVQSCMFTVVSRSCSSTLSVCKGVWSDIIWCAGAVPCPSVLLRA